MLKQIFQGLFNYLKALRLINQLGLWRYVFIPGLISLVLAAIIFTSVWTFSDNIGVWATSWYNWQKGGQIVDTIGTIVSGLLMLVLAILLFKYIIMVVISPFMGPLSERVEAHLRGEVQPKSFHITTFMADMARSLGLALRNASWEIGMTLPLLLLGLLLPFLAPITAVVVFLIQSYYAGFGNMDYTLERHFDFKGRIQFVKQHKGLAIGNGIIFMALLLTIVGFLIVFPLATVAASMQVVPLLDKENNKK